MEGSFYFLLSPLSRISSSWCVMNVTFITWPPNITESYYIYWLVPSSRLQGAPPTRAVVFYSDVNAHKMFRPLRCCDVGAGHQLLLSKPGRALYRRNESLYPATTYEGYYPARAVTADAIGWGIWSEIRALLCYWLDQRTVCREKWNVTCNSWGLVRRLPDAGRRNTRWEWGRSWPGLLWAWRGVWRGSFSALPCRFRGGCHRNWAPPDFPRPSCWKRRAATSPPADHSADSWGASACGHQFPANSVRLSYWKMVFLSFLDENNRFFTFTWSPHFH